MNNRSQSVSGWKINQRYKMENATQLEKAMLLLIEMTKIMGDLLPYHLDIKDLDDLIEILTRTRDVAHSIRTEQKKYLEGKYE